MFLPHNHQTNNKSTHTASTHVPQNKQKNSNHEYIAFIRNNHNMIEKHLLNEFEHPYKHSLMKSHGVGNGESNCDKKISKEESGNPQHYSSLFTLEQAA